MLDELFRQHPPPWRVDCALTEFEAYAAVRDANESLVWEADDGTAQRAGRGALRQTDILLAHAIAALPELLNTNEATYSLLTEYGDSCAIGRGIDLRVMSRAALAKVGVNHA